MKRAGDGELAASELHLAAARDGQIDKVVKAFAAGQGGRRLMSPLPLGEGWGEGR